MGDYAASDNDDCCCQDCEDCYYDDEDYGGSWDDGYDGNSVEALQAAESKTVVRDAGSSTQVITKDSLFSIQRDELLRVMDFLSLKEHHARALLIYHRWDVDKVLQLFIERGKESLYAEAGVTIMDDEEGIRSHLSSSKVECSICFDDVSAGDVTFMECGHLFCNDCWTQHFIVKINEGQSRRIRCMAPKCKSVCDDAKIRELVSARDAHLAEKFDRFLMESYIEDNKRVKWCPSVPHCGNAIRVEDDELCEVECACGLQFCFGCSSEAHSPCSCLMWDLWSKKCQDSSATVNYIDTYTKPCPKCLKLVEKNGGCNLVVCVCGQPFCWLCGAATGIQHDWNTIAGHSCGRYSVDLMKKAEAAKRNLDRYFHYYTRYKAHLDSLKLEHKLKEIVEDKISILEERKSTFIDYSWIRNGLCRLFRTRRIVACTYAFAFYMFGDDLFEDEMTSEEKKIKQNLFEDQQQRFEANIEKLSSLLEEKFDKFNEDRIQDLRMRIIAVTCSTDNLCRNMYDCMENDLLGSLNRTVQKIAPYKSKVLY